MRQVWPPAILSTHRYAIGGIPNRVAPEKVVNPDPAAARPLLLGKAEPVAAVLALARRDLHEGRSWTLDGDWWTGTFR